MEPMSKISNPPRTPEKKRNSGIFRRCSNCGRLIDKLHEATDHIKGLCDHCNHNVIDLYQSYDSEF